MHNAEGGENGERNEDMVKEIVAELVDEASVPGAIWSLGGIVPTGRQ